MLMETDCNFGSVTMLKQCLPPSLHSPTHLSLASAVNFSSNRFSVVLVFLASCGCYCLITWSMQVMDKHAGAHASIFSRGESGRLNSLSVVLSQEIDRFNRLIKQMTSSLKELQKAIKGIVVMSDELEQMLHSMLDSKVGMPVRSPLPCRVMAVPMVQFLLAEMKQLSGMQVPQLWAKVAYPCLKPLGSWFKDFLRRVTFLRTWLTTGQPSCFWLPGFFFPQGFLTGVLQVHARKYTIPIDTLSFQFAVSDHSEAVEVCSP